jgi:hypothetical protein
LSDDIDSAFLGPENVTRAFADARASRRLATTRRGVIASSLQCGTAAKELWKHSTEEWRRGEEFSEQKGKRKDVANRARWTDRRIVSITRENQNMYRTVQYVQYE